MRFPAYLGGAVSIALLGADLLEDNVTFEGLSVSSDSEVNRESDTAGIE